MRKQVYGRKFKRDKNARQALFSGLISAMILRGRIETTLEKAKAIKPDLEKLVTKAKEGMVAQRILSSHLKPFEVEKMINQIGPTFKDRSGGYTRVIKTGRRLSDNAQVAILEWVDQIMEKPATTETLKKTETQKLRASKKLRASVVSGKTSKQTSLSSKKRKGVKANK